MIVNMMNPPHPGEIIRNLCIEPLGLTITQAAQGLGVTRKTLSQVLNGRSGISPEMAIRLSKAFRRSPECWLALQSLYDLAQITKEGATIDVKPLFQDSMSEETYLPWSLPLGDGLTRCLYCVLNCRKRRPAAMQPCTGH